VLSYVLKLLVQRPRPGFAEPLVDASGYSFPSGHATSSAAFVMALALLATGWVKRWESRVYILLAAVALEAAIGFSRLYLGAHYLTDVLAGYTVGAFWATICITAATMLTRGGGVDARRQNASPDASTGEADARRQSASPDASTGEADAH
jgi:membrane-associated phospholipid phosphatase